MWHLLPDWREAYKDHERVLIANVDCIGAGKSKCAEVGVKTYPTLKRLGQSDSCGLGLLAVVFSFCNPFKQGMVLRTTSRRE